jgi:hypothetical protein
MMRISAQGRGVPRAEKALSTLTGDGSVCARKTGAWRGSQVRNCIPGREIFFFIFRREIANPPTHTRAQTRRMARPAVGCKWGYARP